MSKVTVAKFGGTSVADAEAMRRCAAIVTQTANTRVVVLSASSGVTNLLVDLARGTLSAAEQEIHLQKLKTIQDNILKGLGNPSPLRETIDGVLKEIADMARQATQNSDAALEDRLVAQGELMSTRLFTEMMNQLGHKAVWFDVRKIMRTDSRFGRATPAIEAIHNLAQQEMAALLKDHIVITQGFIGANADGQTTTLGRGGSDFSAALLAEALSVDELEIWTDVPGIYTTDPRMVKEAHPIPEITFAEAAEMATFGAKVLHPATLQPAVRKGIPVFVGSSKDPSAGGTWVRDTTESSPLFRAVALRRNQILLTLHSPNMLHACGFLAQVFTILAKHGISVDLITTSEISVAITLDQTGSQSNGRSVLHDGVLDELNAFCKVKVESDLALVALIGNRMSEVNGVGTQVFDAVSEHNVRMICYGASTHNLCFLVPEADASLVVQKLHQRLLTK
ncbi:lysine-sensitive aspartokinase 3 [Tolumonas lignilytica]|uniref:lysine-sensitive aspartokinase 3 n=1 Tax=Tolumonas lignilytica TaxID=1283284 RepID=UPI000467236A|nr:lysine-sensitive aspartokinase 3 [Tolumonas lignilytica]